MPSREIASALAALHKSGETFAQNEGTLSFIDTVLTEGEQIVIGRRILIAQLILQGFTYYEINDRLQVSPNTFSKVRKWLASQMPNYETVLKEVSSAQAEKAAQRDKRTKQRIEPFSLAALKKKYPMHFLLLNLIDELRK